jgi:exosortase
MTSLRDETLLNAAKIGVTWRGAAACLAFAVLAAPTLLANARQSWSGEQGAQEPIVLAIGLWLLARQWPAMRRAASPTSIAVASILFAAAGLLYVLGRVWDQFELESYGLYALAVVGLYATVGASGLRRGWFPAAYLILALPPPYTLTWFLTSHLRLITTEAAVAIFQGFGFSVVRDGLNILIDQYNLSVQDACSGMNSLFSLSAVGVVYVYLRRGPQWWYFALMAGPIVLFAIFGNFVRVLVVIALTHYCGDAVAQGFLHEGTGFLTFLVALFGVVLVDAVAAPFLLNGRRNRLEFAPG